MSYDYKKTRGYVFTEEGVKELLLVRDRADYLLDEAGAFNIMRAFKPLGAYEAWQAFALIDYLVELGELEEVSKPGCRGQDRVFIGKKPV